MEITDRYLERFGRVLIGIYYLPPLTENWKFTVFINSLLVTLRRLDLMPCYSWNIEANGGHYLILWLNGYFRNDLSDCNADNLSAMADPQSAAVECVNGIIGFQRPAGCGKPSEELAALLKIPTVNLFDKFQSKRAISNRIRAAALHRNRLSTMTRTEFLLRAS